MIFIKKKIVVITLVIGVIITCAFGGVYADSEKEYYIFPSDENLLTLFSAKNPSITRNKSDFKYKFRFVVNDKANSENGKTCLVTCSSPFLPTKEELFEDKKRFFLGCENRNQSRYDVFIFNSDGSLVRASTFGNSMVQNVNATSYDSILVNHQVAYSRLDGSVGFFEQPQFSLGAITKIPMKNMMGDFSKTCGTLLKVGVGILATFLVIGLIRRIIFWGL